MQGQGFWAWNLRTHPELDWQVITTKHFNIYYHQGLADVARRGAAIAEQVYQPIMDQLQVADFGRTDMIFTAEDEIMNGFAMPSNQIFIWAYQNDAVGWFTGSEKWLKTVIAHEFQHVVLMNGVKTWLGTLNLLMVPGWFIEGVAEYYTERWRVGRSDTDLKIHTYMNRMERLDSHDAGYAKVLYLADKYGDSTIVKLVHYRDDLKIGDRKLLTLPYFFERAFKKVTGQTVSQFNEEWRRAMNTYYYSYRGQKEGVDEVGAPGNEAACRPVALTEVGKDLVEEGVELAEGVVELGAEAFGQEVDDSFFVVVPIEDGDVVKEFSMAFGALEAVEFAGDEAVDRSVFRPEGGNRLEPNAGLAVGAVDFLEFAHVLLMV